jgi:BolA protein
MTNQESRATRLETALRQAFSPALLEVEDESARHAGHAGARDGGETHYQVTIVSESFTNIKRVDRSRMVHNALSNEFAIGLHALSLNLRSPSEV